MKQFLVLMRRYEEERSTPDPEMVEVFWFDWEPGHPFPREGETLNVDGLPLIVRKITWNAFDRNLHPWIEVSRRPDHPALRQDEDQDEESGGEGS